ncbi:MAG: ATP-binding protein [Dehalococcoidia bacterium]
MTAEVLLARLTEAAFVALAVVTLGRALRVPRRVKIHTAAFFGLVGAIVLTAWATDAGLLGEDDEKVTTVVQCLLVALPYPLLLLAGDFTGVRTRTRRAAEGALALSIAGLFALDPDPLPTWFVLFVVAYFVVTATYASAQFVHAAITMRGVSRLRMGFAAAGSLSLAGVIFISGFMAFVDSSILTLLSQIVALASGLAYYVAFAMPAWVKRTIHARDLQRFLRITVDAAPDIYRGAEGDAFVEIEQAVGDALGTPFARVALWDEERGHLYSPTLGGTHPDIVNPYSTVPLRAYREQVSVFTEDAGADDPENARLYGGMVMLAVPMTLDGERFGVLTAYGGLPPFIHDDDLGLLEVMANQVAVLLRDRQLFTEVSEARAREETLRLMDDFFAAVAHDLKTPLTTILGQGQRLQRQLRRDQAIDPHAIEGIVQQAVHMRRLVEDLLDDARDRGRYSGERVPTDLHVLAQEVATHAPTGQHIVRVGGASGVAPVDAERIRQVLTNLLENAVKYSPDGGEITITVTDQGDCVDVAVSDQGIGIPPADLDTIFERFSRGSREPDRRFSGLGLGLYTCRRIVEEHGGRIDVESRLGAGSTFTVHIPTKRAAVSGEVGYAQTSAGD